MTQSKTKRIEYIDALRGFAIFLVVIHHIYVHCTHVYATYSYNHYIEQVQMPLFFFVSGFVFFKVREWNILEIRQFFSKKITSLIVSPLLFMIVFLKISDGNVLSALFDEAKGGYWFTFSLFEYFVIYVITTKIGLLLRGNLVAIDVLQLLVGLLFVIINMKAVEDNIQMPKLIKGLFGYYQLRFYLFFAFGATIRHCWSKVENMISSSRFLTVIIMSFFLINIYINELCVFSGLRTFLLVICSVTGILVLFVLFMKNEASLNNKRFLGRILNYIGRRTLDIYFLHYFFLPTNLDKLFPALSHNDYPFVEFVFCSIVAIFVLLASLCVSRILRLSPMLAHFLFGSRLP